MLKVIVKKYIDFRSFKTSRKFIVIESDDWGSERTKNKEVYKKLLQISPKIGNDFMTKYDSIASEADLSLMFDLFSNFKDKNGSPLVMTANVCMANPDFSKIQDSCFEDFFYEPFYESIAKRPDGAKILSLWKTGMSERIFFPQLHGREHVHALAWLKELKGGNKELLDAFKLGSWSIPFQSLYKQRRQNLMASLDLYGLPGEKDFQIAWLKEGAAIFESFFKYKSTTFIPPAYTWHPFIKDYLYDLGICGVQGISLHYVPHISGKLNFKKALHINGSKLAQGVIRITRNAFFEPFSNPNRNWADECLQAVELAFKNRQPAIIGTHRVNFIGSLDESNRDRNLRDFKILFNTILKKWPDVEFITSAELLGIMKSENAS